MPQDLTLEWDVEEEGIPAGERRNENAPRRPSPANVSVPVAQRPQDEEDLPEALEWKRSCEAHPNGPGVGGN